MSVQEYPIPRDVQRFLKGYPGGTDEPIDDNLKFYTNQLRCRPDNILIDDLHLKWQGAYDTLEWKHGFIQWLFPIREPGMNGESQVLQPHEIIALRANPKAIERLVTSYRLMLDFYGMRLVSEETGAIDRALPRRNDTSHWQHRYRNLVQSGHNYLRISRILKCLSEFGLERMNAAFLLHVLSEQSSEQLNNRSLIESMDRWWLNCIRNDEEREWIAGVRRSVREGQPLTRDMYMSALERRLKTGSFKEDTQ